MEFNRRQAALLILVAHDENLARRGERYGWCIWGNDFFGEADMEISGSCVCNAVQLKVSGAPKSVVNCHCNFCRTHSGAAFSTYVAVPEAALEIVSGADSLAVFKLGETAHKHFCKHCGSPLFNKNELYPGLCMIYLGRIPEWSTLAPTANIYCDSQLAWLPSITEMRSFAQGFVRRTEK